MAKVKGLDKLIKDLVKLGDEGIKVVAGVTQTTAETIARDAKILAPVGDTGKLQQSIKPIKIENFKWKVLANATGLAPYAAYQEFGTGGLVEVPSELAEMAIKFKGKGIKKVDLRPQPFMYPALVKGRKQYVEDLQSELEILTKKV